MKLTRYTDYAIRVLLHLAAREEGLSSIAEIARAYGISQSHLMKVVNDLGAAGYVQTVRGRNGGVRLGRSADEINLGELVRHTEADFNLVDCPNCAVSGACGLPAVLGEAIQAFLGVLDNHTLADISKRRSLLREALAFSA